MNPLIINVALTGMVPMPDRAPHVPITAEQILADVERCAALGATVFHVHARDADGVPDWRRSAYEPIVRGIRDIDPRLVVCVTTSGRLEPSVDRRGDVLALEGDARPDMASLTLGSNNFRTSASVNAPEVIEGLAARMSEHGIKPELEVFEPGMLAYGADLARRGLLPDPGYVNILLGSPGTASFTVPSLNAFLAEMPTGWSWALAGIGRYQLDANLLAIPLGGHVRVGIEDNIWFDRGREKPARNADLVQRIAAAAALAERPLATPEQTRAELGLAPATSAGQPSPSPVAG